LRLHLLAEKENQPAAAVNETPQPRTFRGCKGAHVAHEYAIKF
jgi:hypothetical protein